MLTQLKTENLVVAAPTSFSARHECTSFQFYTEGNCHVSHCRPAASAGDESQHPYIAPRTQERRPLPTVAEKAASTAATAQPQHQQGQKQQPETKEKSSSNRGGVRDGIPARDIAAWKFKQESVSVSRIAIGVTGVNNSCPGPRQHVAITSSTPRGTAIQIRFHAEAAACKKWSPTRSCYG